MTKSEYNKGQSLEKVPKREQDDTAGSQIPPASSKTKAKKEKKPVAINTQEEHQSRRQQLDLLGYAYLE